MVLLLALCGAAVGAAVAAQPAGAAGNQDYGFLNQIGRPGTAPGQFGDGSSPCPYDVAVDAAGDVFVVSPNSGNAVQKFAPGGTYVCGFGPCGPLPCGSTAGSIRKAYGIAVSPTDTVFVIDTWRLNPNRIQCFTTNDGGATYESAGEIAVHAEQGTSFQIAADGVGNVYITDIGATKRVLKYRASDGALVATIGTTGTGDALLGFPMGVAVSTDGRDLYVVDNSVLKRFHSDDGSTYGFAQKYGGGSPFAWGIALDAAGCIYLAAPAGMGGLPATDLVTKLDPSGSLVTAWGSPGAGDYGLRGGRALAVSASGCVYVVDSGWSPDEEHHEYATENHRVMRYARDLTPPASVVKGLPKGWTKASKVTLTFSGDDPVVADQFSSGYDRTQVFEEGAWTDLVGAQAVTAQGVTTVQYRAVDKRENAESEQTLTVRIDRTRPVPKPLANVVVRRGAKATFRFRVTDEWSPEARAKIEIRKGGKLVKRLKVGQRMCGVATTHVWKCTLAKGTYTWTVTATDLAGNVQARTYAKKLTVR